MNSVECRSEKKLRPSLEQLGEHGALIVSDDSVAYIREQDGVPVGGEPL